MSYVTTRAAHGGILTLHHADVIDPSPADATPVERHPAFTVCNTGATYGTGNPANDIERRATYRIECVTGAPWSDCGVCGRRTPRTPVCLACATATTREDTA